MFVAAYMRSFCAPRHICPPPQKTKSAHNLLHSPPHKRRLPRDFSARLRSVKMTYEADCRIHPNNTVTKDTEKIPQKNKKMRNFICGNLLKKAPQKRCVFAALFSNFTNNSANNFINYLNFYLIFQRYIQAACICLRILR